MASADFVRLAMTNQWMHLYWFWLEFVKFFEIIIMGKNLFNFI